jgi:hypothetical protein
MNTTLEKKDTDRTMEIQNDINGLSKKLNDTRNTLIDVIWHLRDMHCIYSLPESDDTLMQLDDTNTMIERTIYYIEAAQESVKLASQCEQAKATRKNMERLKLASDPEFPVNLDV